MTPRETITLDARAQQRLTVLTHVLAGELTLDAAATYLRLSTRQVRRLLDELRADGAAALIHANRGRRPANRIDDPTAARVVELARTTYAGFNPVHLAECLAEDPDEPLVLSPRTVRRILAAEGVIPPRTRRRSPGHPRRERMPREGMLLQADGSRHDWLEGRGSWLTLVGGIDDATGRVPGATFRAAEDAAGYFAMLTATVTRHGIPLALYTDLHAIFIKNPNRPPTLTEQLTGRQSLTQVGRALEDAGIRWIGARSPQAKGRAERLWGTLQDRLVSELRRAGVATLEDANAVLAWYLPRHNHRFGVPAADPEPAWRPWPEGPAPEAVFCFHYPRRLVRPGGHLAGAARWQPLGEPRRGLRPARPGARHRSRPAGPAPAPGARAPCFTRARRPGAAARAAFCGVVRHSRAPASLAAVPCRQTQAPVTKSLAAYMTESLSVDSLGSLR